MSPSLAFLIWLVSLVLLLIFDPARKKGVSLALWIPLTYFFNASSRLPSMWMGGQGFAAQAMEEGNATDRVIYIILMALAFTVLISRSFKWGEFFSRNLVLTLYLGFCLISVSWSDFPFVAFKRWFRDIGQYLAVLLIISDPDPLEAIRTVFRRACYLLLPLCILLNKYYPEMGKQYDAWTGKAYFVGATTSKNMLGLLCLFAGLFFLWDTLIRWSDRRDRRTKLALLVNAVFFWMAVWLLMLADSATSRLCLVLGGVILVVAQSRTIKRHPALLTFAIPIGVCVYELLAFGFDVDINAMLATAVGRDPTLTGRTHIWDVLLDMNTNPLVGTGYESFWLGDRLLWVWQQAGGINEAHNGYLQMYLNLGWIGVALLIALLLSLYISIARRWSRGAAFGSLGMAVWAVLLFYNNSEAAFGTGLLWLTLLPIGLSAGELQSASKPAAQSFVSQPVPLAGWPRPRSSPATSQLRRNWAAGQVRSSSDR